MMFHPFRKLPLVLCATAASLLTGCAVGRTQARAPSTDPGPALFDAHCAACRQDAEPCDHRTFGTCPSHEIDAPHLNRHTMHDDWPANMILG